MPSKRVLLLAATTGYGLRTFRQAAGRLDVELVLATDRCHVLEDPWGDRAVPVRFEDVPASAEVIATRGPFDGLVALDDTPTALAAEVAARLDLPYHSPSAVQACRNKFLARRRFAAAGLPVPWFFRIGPRATAIPRGFPCVLKPVGLSASRGVIRADNEDEFHAAFDRIRRMPGGGGELVVEGYIEGREFAVEGLLTRGRFQPLALIDKPDPLEGPFFEETIYVTPSREDPGTRAAILKTVERAAAALGLHHGPLHAELRYNASGAWMLEIGARPIGGLCARALRFDGGMPLEELILRHAAGEDVAGLRGDPGGSGVMMIPIPRAGIYQGVSGIEQARGVPAVEDVIITAKQGQRLLPLPEGASYLGFIFARGDTPAQAEAALRQAHAALRFEVATELATIRPLPSAARSPAAGRRPPRKSIDPSG